MATPQDIEAQALRDLASAAIQFAETDGPSIVANDHPHFALVTAANEYARQRAEREGRDLIRERIDKWVATLRNVDNPTSCKGRVASEAIAILMEHKHLFRMAGRMRDLLKIVIDENARIPLTPAVQSQYDEIKTVVELTEPPSLEKTHGTLDIRA